MQLLLPRDEPRIHALLWGTAPMSEHVFIRWVDKRTFYKTLGILALLSR